MMSIRPLTKGIRWLHCRHKAWFPGSLPLNSRFLITDHTPAPGPALHTASLDEPWYWISWNNIRVKVNKESINWSILSILSLWRYLFKMSNLLSPFLISIYTSCYALKMLFSVFWLLTTHTYITSFLILLTCLINLL